MCGPANFEAFYTCVAHIAELSAAGLTSYAVYRSGLLSRYLRPQQQPKDGLQTEVEMVAAPTPERDHARRMATQGTDAYLLPDQSNAIWFRGLVSGFRYVMSGPHQR